LHREEEIGRAHYKGERKMKNLKIISLMKDSEGNPAEEPLLVIQLTFDIQWIDPALTSI
jgi:hypothetical protein